MGESIMENAVTIDLPAAAVKFKADIDSFTEAWVIGMRTLDWPKLLTIEDWQEQFDSWLSMRTGEGVDYD